MALLLNCERVSKALFQCYFLSQVYCFPRYFPKIFPKMFSEFAFFLEIFLGTFENVDPAQTWSNCEM